jgi:hypothetical protein
MYFECFLQVPMILRKLAVICTLVPIVFGSTACRKEPTPTNQAQPANAQPAATPTPAPSPTPEIVLAAPSEFKKTLTGAIDENLSVQMELTRKGNQLTGNYHYDKPGAANVALKTISLTGKVDKDGKTTLVETTSTEQGEEKTGEFKGALDAVMNNGELSLRFLGVWTNLKSKKSVPFSLLERRFELGGYKLTERKLQEKNKKLRMGIDAVVPQLTGADAAGAEKFNKAVNEAIAAPIREFKKEVIELAKEEQEMKTTPKAPASPAGEAAKPVEQKPAEQPSTAQLPPHTFDGSYEIVFANADLVSVLFYYSIYQGGAHPNHLSATLNYDLKRGAEVKLADLFAPKSNYLKLISEYCIKELKKLSTTSDVETGAGPKLENFRNWNATPLGLKFTFDHYQVGAYAVGAHEVMVPYAALKPALKAEGWLAPLAQ